MTRIALVAIQKTYPRQTAPALADVSLTAESGTLLALLGPSGSGKSTLLKLVAGIERPDAGEIRFDGEDVLRLPAHRRGAVLMFQKAYLFPFLSVADNIAFGLKMQGVRRAAIHVEVARMLELVKLPGTERKHPAQLSGGQQQRVALARALVARPRVLLLDEPFSSLDPAVRQTLQEAVRQIQHKLGITTLLVTHDRGEALAMADRVALIDHGTLLACDLPSRLFLRPPTSRAARLMGITTFLHGELVGDRLHTCLGALSVSLDGASSGSATFAIRPEHMRLCAAPGSNTLPAQVTEQRFHGEHSEYQLLVGGTALWVRSFEPPTCCVGSDIFVQLPSEHLFPVHDDEHDERPA